MSYSFKDFRSLADLERSFNEKEDLEKKKGRKKMNYYSVYDKIAEVYSVLTPSISDEVYIRGLTGALCSQPDSMYRLYPDDYDIYCIGEFDETTGIFATYAPCSECGDEDPESPLSRKYVCSMRTIVRNVDLILKKRKGDDIKNGDEEISN